MKAAPLLRAWLARLRAAGLAVHVRHRWRGWAASALRVRHAARRAHRARRRRVLALGGASWPQLGSDGAWVPLLAERGVAVSSSAARELRLRRSLERTLRERVSPARRSRRSSRPSRTARAASTGSRASSSSRPTASKAALIYALSAPLRDRIHAAGSATLHLDLAPGWELARLVAELSRPRGRRSLSSHVQSRVGVKGAKMALLREVVPAAELADPQRLAAAIKALPLELVAPRPLAEAISTAGGVAFEALDGTPDDHGRCPACSARGKCSTGKRRRAATC